jgi:uncharacterized protein (DUF1684 family)
MVSLMATRTPFDMSRDQIEEDVALYRRARVGRLTSEKGWLSLIGKFWLTPGRHRIGSAPGSEIELPADRAPAFVGSVTLENGVVRLDGHPEVDLRARGARVTSLVLRSDAEPDPDDVVLGSLTLQLIRRGDDLAIRVRDSESRARLSFPGIPAYPVDPDWRIVTHLEAFSIEREVVFDDSDGRPQKYMAPGIVTFEKSGVLCRLLPVFETDRKRLFVLFSDRTNRDETYGAGRFLYAPLPHTDRILLDFNKAFNPPCAFTPYAVCPLPPADNHLALRVEAGEKRPAEH